MPAGAMTCDPQPRVPNVRGGGEGQSCPCCGGPLLPTRAAWRCGRCSFCLCAGCEPGPAPPAEAGESES